MGIPPLQPLRLKIDAAGPGRHASLVHGSSRTSAAPPRSIVAYGGPGAIDKRVTSVLPSAADRVHGNDYKGEWRPALQHVAEALAEQTGIRDYLDGEKVVQAFLAAHFSMVGQFVIHTERELDKGYADLYLEPFVAQYPDVGYGYVVEVKYLKRSERVDGSVIAERMGEARAQLAGYLADEGLRRFAPSVRHVGLAVVFHGWELAACEAVEPGRDGGDPAFALPTGS